MSLVSPSVAKPSLELSKAILLKLKTHTLRTISVFTST